jgi:hypothetical protein
MKFNYRGAECIVFEKDSGWGATFVLPTTVKLKPECDEHEIGDLVKFTVDRLISKIEELQP